MDFLQLLVLVTNSRVGRPKTVCGIVGIQASQDPQLKLEPAIFFYVPFRIALVAWFLVLNATLLLGVR